MEGPPLGPGGEDITWPDQVAPRGRKASSSRKIKPQTSNHKTRHHTPPQAPTAAHQHTVVPPRMRYTAKTLYSQPTRGHHGTHDGDAKQDPPTAPAPDTCR